MIWVLAGTFNFLMMIFCVLYLVSYSFVLNYCRYLWKVSVHSKEYLDHNDSRYTRPTEAPTICLQLILGNPSSLHSLLTLEKKSFGTIKGSKSCWWLPFWSSYNVVLFYLLEISPDNSTALAHCSFNQLDLPEYTSKEQLQERLLLAIHEANEGFGFG